MMILDHCKPSNLGDEPNIFSRGFRPRNPHGFEKYRFSMKNTGFGNTDYSFVFSEVGRSDCGFHFTVSEDLMTSGHI